MWFITSEVPIVHCFTLPTVIWSELSLLLQDVSPSRRVDWHRRTQRRPEGTCTARSPWSGCSQNSHLTSLEPKFRQRKPLSEQDTSAMSFLYSTQKHFQSKAFQKNQCVVDQQYWGMWCIVQNTKRYICSCIPSSKYCSLFMTTQN